MVYKLQALAGPSSLRWATSAVGTPAACNHVIQDGYSAAVEVLHQSSALRFGHLQYSFGSCASLLSLNQVAILKFSVLHGLAPAGILRTFIQFSQNEAISECCVSLEKQPLTKNKHSLLRQTKKTRCSAQKVAKNYKKRR